MRTHGKIITKLIKFENTLSELDLVSHFSIKRFNKKHLYYEIIFNGTPTNFLNTMKDKNYKFDTQKKIWILK